MAEDPICDRRAAPGGIAADRSAAGITPLRASSRLWTRVTRPSCGGAPPNMSPHASRIVPTSELPLRSSSCVAMRATRAGSPIALEGGVPDGDMEDEGAGAGGRGPGRGGPICDGGPSAPPSCGGGPIWGGPICGPAPINGGGPMRGGGIPPAPGGDIG